MELFKMNIKYKTYIKMLLPIIIIILLSTLFSFYSIGVIEKDRFYNKMQLYNESISEYLDSQTNYTYNEIINQLKDEYSSKTRTAALVLKSSNDILNENYLEELRLAIGAEIISLSDSKGNIIASTDSYSDGGTVKKEFINHLNDTLYTDSFFYKTKKHTYIASATTRSDKKGIIQVTYLSKNIINNIEQSELSQCMKNYSFVTSGNFAIINEKQYLYYSCSIPRLNNTTPQFPKDIFNKNIGNFLYDIEGEKSLVVYERCFSENGDSYIVLSSIPYNIIYRTRKIITVWTLFILSIISFIFILYLRKENKNE